MIDKQQGQTDTKPRSFETLGLKEDILRGIYAYGMEKPAPIQSQIIPSVVKGRDVIVSGQSGTGKTTAFAISILQIVNLEVKECQALIIGPTNELATNTKLMMSHLGDFLSVTIDVCKPGQNYELKKGAQVVVGSAQKVHDMIQKGFLKVEHLKICVVDEIDEIFARGFKDQVQGVFERLPKAVQTVINIEKIEPEIDGFIKDFMQDPETISVKKTEMTLDDTKQFYVALEKEEWKNDTLFELLSSIELRKCLIYCNKRKTVLELTEKLREKAFNTSEIHNDMDERHRVATLEDFKNGALSTLLVSGHLVRDPELQEIPLVINYDLPLTKDQYIQRAGRSEKLDKKLVVINFITPEDSKMIGELEKYYNTEIVECPLDLANIFE